jgi:EAL domain-containing protein (putative c-di-GMP-specific phosphodiesterase class I)
MQGFLFSKPLTATAFEDFLRNSAFPSPGKSLMH